MVLWKVQLEPYITVHPSPSPAILPFILQPPRSSPSIHVAIYLPTSGKEEEFVAEISNLAALLHELSASFPEAPIYLRRDFWLVLRITEIL